MNPEHLLEQADLLINRPGRPRQANLRQAVSAAYYAVFHFTLKSAAELVVGLSARSSTPEVYARVYRAIDHGDLRNRLNETRVRSISLNMGKFAAAVVQLQQDRHRADYDPLHPVIKADAITIVSLARNAITTFEASAANEQKACLTFLLFKDRKP